MGGGGVGTTACNGYNQGITTPPPKRALLMFFSLLILYRGDKCRHLRISSVDTTWYSSRLLRLLSVAKTEKNGRSLILKNTNRCLYIHCAIVQLYIQNTITKIIKTVNLRRLVYRMSVCAKLMNENNSGEKLMLFPTLLPGFVCVSRNK
jgi:hypothetical protein